MKSKNVYATRSFSPENFRGEKGRGGMATEGTGAHAARDLGLGWKVSPSVMVNPGETITMADIEDQGELNHLWLTAPNNRMRDLIYRVNYDGEESPSIEVPAADFFCDGWLNRPYVDSKPIKLLPANGYNSLWRMPFREGLKITLENIGDSDMPVYYQGTYNLGKVSKREEYLHATWRRSDPLGDPALFPMLDGVTGTGTYMGAYFAFQPNIEGWWGEGEPKIFLDGDGEFPTICYTGTEDYVGGAWNFDKNHKYVPYTTDYFGLPEVTPSDSIYEPWQRFGLYRWHMGRHGIRFHDDLRINIQAISAGDKFIPLVNADISAMTVWKQTAPNKTPQIPLVEQARALGHASLRDYLAIEPQYIPLAHRQPGKIGRVAHRASYWQHRTRQVVDGVRGRILG